MVNEQKGFINRMRSSFAEIWGEAERMSLRSIRWNRSFYVLAYSFELLFYTIHKFTFRMEYTLYGIDSSMLMYIGHILASLIVMLLWSARFTRLIHASLAVTIIGFITSMFLPDGAAKLICVVLTMAGVGGCVTSARCGFAFAANNSERLIGVSLTLAARALLNFIDHIFPDGYLWDDMLFTYVFPLVFIAGMTFCLLRFRESDMEVKEESTIEDRRGLYWAFIIFIAFFAIDGYMEKAWDYDYVNATLFDGVGNLVAVALFISFLTIIRKNIWHIWNLFFGLTIFLAVLAYTGFAPVINIPVYIVRGVYDIGWIAALYMLGSAQRRFASYKLLKQCTAIFVIVSPITTLSDELTELAFPGQITTVTLFYILAIALAFLMVSPYTQKYLFKAKWLDEMNKLDMTLYADAYKEVERVDKENTFGLTPREMEIFTLLLSGAPFKQISATLDISDNTVRFHSKNLYRKLNIQSRTELYAKYGKVVK